ncbi:DUF4367 domain-containing protein [Desulfosporosinus lacus]|uniref:DUF4367 domain-containing protein n=1 Tax=Desulfosporosinus lacus DSM 15449 TaxID=1121420 RepID=A0A1M5YQT2_9FIRM|nr:DUF4367 domain-containing protein [Desulfosporosinus lacus]SHI14218.1 protein of unknown function [Desulfosporosinus lacus DSM 15449]
MALSEIELNRTIKDHFSKELAETIEVPNIDNQWEKIKQQILETETIPPTQRSILKQKRIVLAITILLSIGSVPFLRPNNANAFGGTIAKFFNYMVGKTTNNITETYQQGDESGIPKVQDLGDITEKEVSLDEVHNMIPFMLAAPSYLPLEANTRRIVLTSHGADVYQITFEYNLKDKVIVFSQQNNASGTSRGSLYDSEDTVIKDLMINADPAILFMHKNGISTLNWQSRSLLLQLKGQLSEEEIIKIAQSIK